MFPFVFVSIKLIFNCDYFAFLKKIYLSIFPFLSLVAFDAYSLHLSISLIVFPRHVVLSLGSLSLDYVSNHHKEIKYFNWNSDNLNNSWQIFLQQLLQVTQLFRRKLIVNIVLANSVVICSNRFLNGWKKVYFKFRKK